MNDFLSSINNAASFLLSFISVTILGAAPVIVGVYFVVNRMMAKVFEGQERSRYDDMRREAVLSEIRSSYEHRIADLTREMVATRARWEDANHLLIASQKKQVDLAPGKVVDVEGFLGEYGIDANVFEVIDERIFVLTPFSNEERPVYEEIKSVCSEAGFSVLRGDEQRAEGDILPQIVRGIVSSGIVIANISSRNPNVFFELGIAVALGKPTLLLSDTISDVPFDIQMRRIIVFKGLDDLRLKLTTALLQTVRTAKA